MEVEYILNFLFLVSYHMYAVINLWGHQRLVQENQQIVVDRMDGDVWSALSVTDVLMTFDASGSPVAVWTPLVEGAMVTAKILDHQQGDKLHVIKFQNKKRHRRKIGFRPQQTVLLIEKINV